MRWTSRLILMITLAVGFSAGGAVVSAPANATNMPMPYSCAHSIFGEIHDGYLWWFKLTGQRFSGGSYYNTYSVGLTGYPSGVNYIGSIEKACGRSSYLTTG